MRCLHPITLQETGITVPCRRCLECRIRIRKEWALRCLHELESHTQAVFATLTYEDRYLPQNGSLKKSDLQKFFKRLRRRLSEDGRRCRYFASGEYGSETYRPHYHAIIFGVGLTPAEKAIIKESWHYTDWSVKEIDERAFGEVVPQTIEYVTGYIHDKLSGQEEKFIYEDTGRENVFKLSSQGLGKEFCDNNWKQIEQLGYLKMNGKKVAVPRYYINRLGFDTADIKRRGIESECANNLNKYGLEKVMDEIYLSDTTEAIRMISDHKKSENIQHDKNLKARINLHKKNKI